MHINFWQHSVVVILSRSTETVRMIYEPHGNIVALWPMLNAEITWKLLKQNLGLLILYR